MGIVAHIRGRQPGSARYDSQQTVQERNAYPNLIYMCVQHATQIDKKELEADYPVELLLEMKREHEEWVEKTLQATIPRVTFAELETVARVVGEGALYVSQPDFTLVPPRDKIRRNSLGPKAASLLTMGIAKAGEVQQFVDHQALLDPTFPDRLKAGFVTEYMRLRAEEYDGDKLFAAMQEFATAGSTDFARAAAGLAVLAYLFEKCDIFEK